MHINANIIGQSKGTLIAEYLDYKTRVEADGGTIESPSLATRIIKFLVDNSIYADTEILVSPVMGVKERNSTIYTFFSKLYDASTNDNDAAQTTEFNQPYKSGNIADNEKAKVLNPNGDTNLMTFTEIAYNNSTAWSLIIVANFFGSNNIVSAIVGKGNDTASIVSLRDASTNRIELTNDTPATGTGIVDISDEIGKQSIIMLVADGAGNLKFYREGALEETIVVNTDFKFSQFIKALATAGSEFFGNISLLGIISSDITSIASSLNSSFRSIFASIESVIIGSQEWATSNLDIACTPEGNVINEVQLYGDTEKITNAEDREFSSDTGFWRKTGTANIGGGKCNLPGSGDSIYKTGITTVERWNKIEVNIDSQSGSFLQISKGGVNKSIFGTGSKSTYIKPITTGALYITEIGAGAIIDNVSDKEVGWAGLGDLYDWLIKEGYTVHDALKEAAAWCYYNNDSANGVIYGKLYNWYAASLIDTDMGTASYGWHVPTEVEFNTLVTALGGSSVAGGKMKKEGADYWNSPNNGADNESGFTGLGTGYRNTDGSFTGIKQTEGIWAVDKAFYLRDIYASTLILNLQKLSALIIRLIKD